MDRVEKLKNKLLESFHLKKEWWGDDLTIFDQPGIEDLPLIMRKAIAFEKVCQDMPLSFNDDELIIGTALMSSVGFGANFPKYETDAEAAQFAEICLSRKSVWGHHLPYYPKVLSKGYEGIIIDIDNELASVTPNNKEKIDFLKAAKHTLIAATQVSLRYAELLEKKAELESDITRKSELKELISICQTVPMRPAKNFHEALQSVWFVHMILHSTLSNTPLGRIDQFLWPYYEFDIRTGVLTKEKAEELVGCFLIKFNERTIFNKEHMESRLTGYDWSQGGDAAADLDLMNSNEFMFGQSANHWLQSITVSGLGEDGQDQTNDLSYMFIKMLNKLQLISPMINARIHKDTPTAFLKFISEALCEGGAQPALVNDDVIIKGLIEHMHYPPKEAYDYATDGCWETLIYGRTEFTFGFIELLPCMEALVNNGKRILDNALIGKDFGEIIASFDTFEKFYKAYIEQMYSIMDATVATKLKYYDEVHKIAPEPFLSNFVLDCIENGRDLTNRGARYRLYSLYATGLSHAVDSLSVVKKLVFDQNLTTLTTLVDAIKNNWNGYEDLRLMALNRTPKYGNDDPESNAILTRLITDFCEYTEQINKRVDWLDLSPGVATFENYSRFGYTTAASFDGRFDREPISSNYSPAVGRDKQGPTAVLLSSARPDLSRMSVGCPLDLRINFDKSDGSNSNVLYAFIKTFIDVGGNILTLSKVDIQTLKKAQEHPEDYQSLRVRLGGLTTYFVQLAKPQQDEYMRRTEHRF